MFKKLLHSHFVYTSQTYTNRVNNAFTINKLNVYILNTTMDN